ncbi:YcjF family protein [Vibrio cincinnatiensis]|uniref:YcjF family protein n=1 Tax=Vibrio cincinnatiensis TaxID=675 RepID=UPI001EDE51F9|nr:TIGR01620 family protein [Vibrio cincinnatiensis]MCG3729075.1 TIGR01620 family protein [Vibrio cincinnatiensis]
MSDLKSKQIFDQPLKQAEVTETLTRKIAFTEQARFVPEATAVEDEGEAEAKLEQIIRPTKRKKRGMVALLVLFSGLIGWQAIDSILSAVQAGDWLALAWSSFLAGVAGLGIGSMSRELWKLRKLRQHFSVQEQAENLIVQDAVGQGITFCESLAQRALINQQSEVYQRWLNSVNDSHSDADIIELYDAMVVSEQDKKATQIVSRHATEAAVLVAVSPLALVDMLFVAWRNFKMIDQLAKMYGVELGYWSRLQLFKAVLVNMALAGATEVAIDASMDLLSMDLTKKISARAGQGLGVGLLTARLGLKAMALLRPLPWQPERAVKLREIRKQIVAKITALVSK